MGKLWYLSAIIIVVLASIGAGDAFSFENSKKLDIAEKNLWDPVLSPDGTKIAYAAYDDARIQQIFVMNADGSGTKKLTNDEFKKWGLSWGPDKIAYVSLVKSGLEKIFVMAPDGSDNRQLIFDDTRQGNMAEDKPPVWAAPSWSPDGKSLVYTSLDDRADPKMFMVNADGTGKKLVFNEEVRQWSPYFSPDGKNIVYASYNERNKIELFIVDAAGAMKKQLTFDEIKKNYPVWGPDGTITYVSYENVSSSIEKIFAINQDGSGKRMLADSDYRQRSPSFSRDGRRFLFVEIDRSGNVDLVLSDVAGIPAATTPPETTSSKRTETATQTTSAETLGGIGGVLWTMFSVLGAVVVVLLVFLAIADFLNKKKK